MMTAIQHLIHSFENDRMQSTYSKEQILNLLNFKLQQEKHQIIDFADEYGTYLLQGGTMSATSYNETFNK